MRVPGEVVCFIDHDDFEALFRGQVHLLSLCYFFEEVLDDDAVVVADVAGGDFEVVVGGDDVEFEFAVAVGVFGQPWTERVCSVRRKVVYLVVWNTRLSILIFSTPGP